VAIQNKNQAVEVGRMMLTLLSPMRDLSSTLIPNQFDLGSVICTVQHFKRYDQHPAIHIQRCEITCMTTLAFLDRKTGQIRNLGPMATNEVRARQTTNYLIAKQFKTNRKFIIRNRKLAQEPVSQPRSSDKSRHFIND